MGELAVTRTLEAFGPAAALVLTDAEVSGLGGGRRAAVRVTIEGRTARLRIAVMGGQSCIGLSKAAHADLGVDIGAVVTARIELDPQTREVELPVELVEALAADSEAKRTFDGLAYTHHKEYATWVAGAKRAQTRERRVAQAVEMLRDGRTRS